MYTVVFDSQTGFLHTGASQLDCKDHKLLRDAGESIPPLRLGNEFANLIDKCCIFWKRECTELRKQQAPFRSTTQRLQGVQEKNPEVFGKIPAFEDTSKILCWTLSGIDFKLRSPCSGCACFYSLWEIFKMVEYETSTYLDYLGTGWSRHSGVPQKKYASRYYKLKLDTAQWELFWSE